MSFLSEHPRSKFARVRRFEEDGNCNFYFVPRKQANFYQRRDMNTGKTSRICQVSEETMFVSDEVFPLPSGDCPLEEMTSRTHFEVNGDGLAAIPTVPQSPGDKGLAPSAARAGGCFLFEARQAATSSGAMPQ